ncbi:MAG: formamidopyrimidine-DNA glycosylase [Chloroflexota bacterium]|jgi:formamidopyrimidine-DNA glycosylase|nr:formamidopyrimidine-DNA glycosylase [Chloroflexota bacterium]
MPELPEVETIARELRPDVVGRTIKDAWFDWPNQIKHPAPSAFVGAVKGREILSVERRAKWLIFALGPAKANGEPAVLAIQVKMTGQLDVVSVEAPRDKHVHAIFALDDGRELRLRDTRKFARLAVYAPDQAAGVLGTLGPEPLGAELTLPEFRRMLRSRKARLKTLLMNQEFLAGVGNIYADEALWRARLHPLRSAANLRNDQARALYLALRDVLNEAIARRGSSVDSYRAPEGSGDMQHYLNVYGRTGKPCPRCGRPTRRMVIGARSTHFCSWCQRLPAAERSASTHTLLAGVR